MLSINFKKFTKISIIIAIFGAITFGYFCVNTFTHHQMDTGIANNTSSIVQNTETCCSTTFLKYSESLKSNLVLPLKFNDFLITFILSITLLFFAINLHFRNTEVNISLLYRLYLRQRPNLFAFDFLKLAFSNGIINPKIF